VIRHCAHDKKPANPADPHDQRSVSGVMTRFPVSARCVASTAFLDSPTRQRLTLRSDHLFGARAKSRIDPVSLGELFGSFERKPRKIGS